MITNGVGSTVSDINRNILEFLFVFLILITSWIIYTTDMSVLPVETRLVTLLNVMLLIFVAIIPYLFDQVVSTVNSSNVQEYASILFMADYAATLIIMALFAHIIQVEEEQLVDGEIMVRFRRSRNILALLSLLVVASILVPWDWLLSGARVRLLVWYVPIVMFWINRMRRPVTSVTALPGTAVKE